MQARLTPTTTAARSTVAAPACSCVPTPRRCRSFSGRQRSVAQHASQQQQQQTRAVADMTIDNLDEVECPVEQDPGADFVCSSAAVEQTVRGLASCISKLKYAPNLFQPDVQYSDGFRSFKESGAYRGALWAAEGLGSPKATVTKLSMRDTSTAVISWTLEGQLAAFSVSIPMTSTFSLNLLTGRVTAHTESWDLRGLSPPVSAALSASRLLWSARAAGADASDRLGKGVSDSLSSLTSMEEDEYTMNPNDPTRFFQKQDNGMNDAFMLATGVAALYLVYKVFEAIETL